MIHMATLKPMLKIILYLIRLSTLKCYGSLIKTEKQNSLLNQTETHDQSGNQKSYENDPLLKQREKYDDYGNQELTKKWNYLSQGTRYL